MGTPLALSFLVLGMLVSSASAAKGDLLTPGTVVTEPAPAPAYTMEMVSGITVYRGDTQAICKDHPTVCDDFSAGSMPVEKDQSRLGADGETVDGSDKPMPTGQNETVVEKSGGADEQVKLPDNPPLPPPRPSDLGNGQNPRVPPVDAKSNSVDGKRTPDRRKAGEGKETAKTPPLPADQRERQRQRAVENGDLPRKGETPEQFRKRREALAEKREKEREESETYYTNLLKNSGLKKDVFGDKKDNDFDPSKLKADRMGSLDSIGAAGGSLGGGSSGGGSSGGGSSAGGSSGGGGRSNATGGSNFRPMNAMRRGINQLASVPSIRRAMTDAGVSVGNGATEADLIAAQQVLNGLPLQAMMEFPGILKQVGGSAVYNRVVEKVERGEGGENIKHMAVDHRSLVWNQACTKGLENCNPHATGTSYSAGHSVPAPAVSSIYNSLFSDDSDGNNRVLQANAKLSRNVKGGSVWDRIKSAFSGMTKGRSAGSESKKAGNSPLLAAAGYLPASGAASRQAGSVQPAVLPQRSLQDSFIPRRIALEDAGRGMTHRDLVWAVSGGLGFTILIVWAFRKRRESEEGSDV